MIGILRTMLFALLTLLASAIAWYMAFHLRAKIHEGRRWPSAMGMILERGIGRPMEAHGRRYFALVKYAYLVSGVEYTNDQVYVLRTTGGTKQNIRTLVDALPSPLPVYYDPADPRRSFLIFNSMSSVWTLLAVGTVTALVGLAMLFVAIMQLS